MLNQGASKEWHTQLMEFMNDDEGNMNAKAIIDYFTPLSNFLNDYISTNGLKVRPFMSS